MKTITRWVVALVMATFLTSIISSSPASAHHTTITCADQATATWSIVNSENRNMTYRTNRGHEGSIGPRGTATVTYEGTSLTVYGRWSNGVKRTNTGEGECIPPTTTTTTPATTSTSTPPSTSTTVVSSTSTVPAVSTTTVPETTSTSSPTTVPASTSTSPTTVPSSTSTPATSTTAPTQTSTSTSCPPAVRVTTIPEAPTPELPATGANQQVALVALGFLALGALLALAHIARRPS